VDVVALDWAAVRAAADPAAVRDRAPEIVARAEALLDAGRARRRAGVLFDDARADAGDRAVHVRRLDPDTPLWFVGDLHGDLLALEAALALASADEHDAPAPRRASSSSATCSTTAGGGSRCCCACSSGSPRRRRRRACSPATTTRRSPSTARASPRACRRRTSPTG
jgi:hypothetical protein